MREIVLDTETTGLDPFEGHRIVEIGCVELVNCIPTGRVWHGYVNPERDVPYAAFEVHGLSTEFLRDKRARADFVISSGTSLKEMHAELDQLIESLQDREARVMERLRHASPE